MKKHPLTACVILAATAALGGITLTAPTAHAATAPSSTSTVDDGSAVHSGNRRGASATRRPVTAFRPSLGTPRFNRAGQPIVTGRVRDNLGQTVQRGWVRVTEVTPGLGRQFGVVDSLDFNPRYQISLRPGAAQQQFLVEYGTDLDHFEATDSRLFTVTPPTATP